MDRPPYAVTRASWLHRRLGLVPGDAPRWLCAGSDCSGIDLLGMIPAAMLVLSWTLVPGSVWWKLASCVAPVVLYEALLHGPFESRERLARARYRRGECIWCGAPGVARGDTCPTCSTGR